MVTIPTVNVKEAQIPFPGVYKCYFGLHGAQSIRSNAKKIERHAARNNRKRGNKTLEDVDYDGL